MNTQNCRVSSLKGLPPTLNVFNIDVIQTPDAMMPMCNHSLATNSSLHGPQKNIPTLKPIWSYIIVRFDDIYG